MIIKSETGIEQGELRAALLKSLEGKTPKKVLLLPPDYTRMYSGAGKITAAYYDIFTEMNVEADIMPARHARPMTRAECLAFFGERVPFER